MAQAPPARTPPLLGGPAWPKQQLRQVLGRLCWKPRACGYPCVKGPENSSMAFSLPQGSTYYRRGAAFPPREPYAPICGSCRTGEFGPWRCEGEATSVLSLPLPAHPTCRPCGYFHLHSSKAMLASHHSSVVQGGWPLTVGREPGPPCSKAQGWPAAADLLMGPLGGFGQEG